MDWAQVLVILLSVLFAIFLIVAIALIVLILQITKQIKSAAASAERTVHAIEDSVGTFKKTALPIMMTKTVLDQVMNRKKAKDE